MKIGLFCDPHYSTIETSCKTRKPRLSYKKLEDAVFAFQKAEVNLIICLGDLIDSDICKEQEQNNLSVISGLIKNSGIPCYCCMGNHDTFIFSKEQFEETSGLKIAPLSFSTENKLFILLDACFRSNGSAYSIGNIEWTDSFIPPRQVEWLKDSLKNSNENEVYVFVHQNLDPTVEEHHIIKNAEEIRSILEDDSRVRTVYQGHYHPGRTTLYKNIEYITPKAMCEGTENSYLIIEI